jgi:hypothetical protein
VPAVRPSGGMVGGVALAAILLAALQDDRPRRLGERGLPRSCGRSARRRRHRRHRRFPQPGVAWSLPG